MIRPIGRQTVDECKARDARGALCRHLERDGAPQRKPDDVGPGHFEVVEEGPKGRGTSADGVLPPGRWAASTARQIGDDHPKSLFERRDLKRPGRSAAS